MFKSIDCQETPGHAAQVYHHLADDITAEIGIFLEHCRQTLPVIPGGGGCSVIVHRNFTRLGDADPGKEDKDRCQGERNDISGGESVAIQ